MKKTKKSNGMNIAIKLVTLIIGTAMAIMLMSVLIAKGMIDKEMASDIAVFLTEGIVLLMTFLVARKLPQKRLLMAIAFAAVFMGLRLLSGMIAFSEFELGYTQMLLTVLAGAGGGMMSAMKKQRRQR